MIKIGQVLNYNSLNNLLVRYYQSQRYVLQRDYFLESKDGLFAKFQEILVHRQHLLDECREFECFSKKNFVFGLIKV